VPGKPTYVRTRTFSDSVMVTWMSPEDGDMVRGYMVGYGEGVPDVNWRYVDASSNNVTIRNLSTSLYLPLQQSDFVYSGVFRGGPCACENSPTNLVRENFFRRFITNKLKIYELILC